MHISTCIDSYVHARTWQPLLSSANNMGLDILMLTPSSCPYRDKNSKCRHPHIRWRQDLLKGDKHIFRHEYRLSHMKRGTHLEGPREECPSMVRGPTLTISLLYELKGGVFTEWTPSWHLLPTPWRDADAFCEKAPEANRWEGLTLKGSVNKHSWSSTTNPLPILPTSRTL